MRGMPPLALDHLQSMIDVPPVNRIETMRRGVLNGITKAQSSGYCSGLSKERMDNLTEIILHHITVEETAAARGFYALHESIPELPASLKAFTPDARGQDRIGDHLEEATANIGMDETTHETSLDDAIDELIREVTANGAIEEYIRIAETTSHSITTTINTIYQASVNRVERMDSRRLEEAIAVSLRKISSPELFKGPLRFSGAKLLEDGNVEVAAHAEHREDLERLNRISPWHEMFERSLGPLADETYDVRMHNMRIGCMTFVGSKEKAAIINALTDENFAVDSDSSNCNVIGNIDFGNPKAKEKQQKTTALVVRFLFPEPANKALENGLWWQGTKHGCNIADHKFSLRRCLNCQHYGHWTQDCLAEPQCGVCAGQHQTQNCLSKPNPCPNKSGAPAKFVNRKCVLCGGPHSSAGRGCLVKEQMKYNHRFPTATLPLVAEPNSQVLDAIKIEPYPHEIISGRSQDHHPRPEIPPQRTDNFRNLEIARNTGLRQDASLGHKREAEGGLPVTASDKELKRIKQEYLDVEKSSSCDHSRVVYQQEEDSSPEAGSDGDYKFVKKEEESPQGGPVYRENPMALYRQPSPYIVHRSG